MADELLTTDKPLAFQLLSLSGRPWAMDGPAFGSLVGVCGQLDFDALASRAGTPLDDRSAVSNYRGTAVVNIRGPLFRYRSIWTWLLGGTAVEQTALDLHAAIDDPGVKQVVLAINSPGGQIDGINELANMIRAANQVKPITAYVDGLAASGGYWLASAAGRIVADETSQLGSIGVLATIFDERAAEEKHGVKRYEIISSQSPLKRTDPATDEGRAQLQEMVDALAQIFIEKVAKFRGTSAETVASAFGRGAVRPAQAAVAVGMADAIGSLESLLGAGDGDPLRQVRNQPALRVAVVGKDGVAVWQTPATQMDEEELEEDTEEAQLNNAPGCDCPPGEECQCGTDDEDQSEGTEQEPDESSLPQGEGTLTKPTTTQEDRQRIAAILNCEEARGREQLARVLALETDHDLETARKILSASPLAAAAPAPNALEARMGQIQNPVVGTKGDQEDDSPATEVQRILAFVPKNRLRAQLTH